MVLAFIFGQVETSTLEGLEAMTLTVPSFVIKSEYPVVPDVSFEQFKKCRTLINIEQISSTESGLFLA